MGDLGSSELLNYDQIKAIFIKYIYKNKSSSKKQYINTFKSYFKACNIEFNVISNNIFITKKDGEKLKEIYSKFNPNEYYPAKEASKLLGLYQISQKALKYFTPIYYKLTLWFPKKQIEYFANLRKCCISFNELKGLLGLNGKSHHDTFKKIINALKEQGVDCDWICDSPYEYILIKGHEYIIKYYRKIRGYVTERIDVAKKKLDLADIVSIIYTKDNIPSPNLIYSYVKMCLHCQKINYEETEHNLFIAVKDGIKIQNLYKDFDRSQYYEESEVNKLLGLSGCGYSKYSKKYKFMSPIVYNNKILFPKKEVDYFVRLKSYTIHIGELKQKLKIPSFERLINAIKIAKKNGVRIELIKNHPWNSTLVLGYKEFINYYDMYKEKRELISFLEEEKDFYRIFSLIIKDVKRSKGISKTLNDFFEFIVTRYNRSNDNQLPKIHAEIYAGLNNNLNKDLTNYNDVELEALIIKLNLSNNNVKKKEFIHFVNFCKNKYPKSFLPNLKQEIKKNNKTKKTSYTDTEWDKFRYLVFNCIDKPEYLIKALNKRSLAMSWLYFAMHFVTCWRAKDILTQTPKPDIELLKSSGNNFKSPEDFLNYFKNGGEFTEKHGNIICKDIVLKIKSYGLTANKNNQMLKIVIPESMVRALGLLLAICEAHRRKASTNNRYNTKYLMTESVYDRKYHKELFGIQYSKIFKDESFSNLKATYTTSKQLGSTYKLTGDYLASVLRGHKGPYGRGARVTVNTYIKHGLNNKDNDVQKICLQLWEMGTFSFVPIKLLSILDNKFLECKLEEQVELVKELRLTPFEIENMAQSLTKQRNIVNNLIDKILKTPDKITIKEILYNVVNGQAPSKHEYASCLLRAIPLEKVNLEQDTGSYVNEFNIQTCLLSNSKTCIGCPLLIGQKLFIMEISARLRHATKKALINMYDRDRQRYNDYVQILKLLLFEAIDALGEEIVEIYISDDLLNDMQLLEELNIGVFP